MYPRVSLIPLFAPPPTPRDCRQGQVNEGLGAVTGQAPQPGDGSLRPEHLLYVPGREMSGIHLDFWNFPILFQHSCGETDYTTLKKKSLTYQSKRLTQSLQIHVQNLQQRNHTKLGFLTTNHIQRRYKTQLLY